MFKDKSFESPRLYLDGKTFENCHFKSCELVVSGVMGFDLPNCRFDECSWNFEGPAAATINILKSLHRAGARELVEQTCADIVGKR